MIPKIDALLSAWGRWALNPIRQDVGYPSRSAGFADYMPVSVEYKSRPPDGIFTSDSSMQDVDAAVRNLHADDRALCVEWYQIGGGASATCARCGVARRTIYEQLHRVHCRIADLMCCGK